MVDELTAPPPEYHSGLTSATGYTSGIVVYPKGMGFIAHYYAVIACNWGYNQGLPYMQYPQDPIRYALANMRLLSTREVEDCGAVLPRGTGYGAESPKVVHDPCGEYGKMNGHSGMVYELETSTGVKVIVVIPH